METDRKVDLSWKKSHSAKHALRLTIPGGRRVACAAAPQMRILAAVDTRIIAVPYDSGLRDTRMGTGPPQLLEAGLVDRLSRDGHAADVVFVEARSSPPAEIRTAFELMDGVAREVRRAVEADRFVIVLGGNCNVSVGVAAGLDDVGVVWFDAHADFEMPDETVTGFFDGMALSILTGRTWHAMASSVSGHLALPGSRLALIGARDFSATERSALDVHGILVISSEAVRSNTAPEKLRPVIEAAEHVHIHLDLDVLDPAKGRANTFAVPGGIAASDVERIIKSVSERARLSAITVASYDPSVDRSGDVGRSALEIVASTVLSAARNGA